MSDNPLEDTPEREALIREKAYHLWQSEGRPEGHDDEFWERARELIGMQQSAGSGQLENPMNRNDPLPGVIVEEAALQENLGEFPNRLTDQGDGRATPMTKDELRDSERSDAP